MVLILLRKYSDNKDNFEQSSSHRGGYLSVTTCPFPHTGLAPVVMETFNMFFFFFFGLPLMLLASVHNESKLRGRSWKSIRAIAGSRQPPFFPLTLKFTGSFHGAVWKCIEWWELRASAQSVQREVTRCWRCSHAEPRRPISFWDKLLCNFTPGQQIHQFGGLDAQERKVSASFRQR